MNEFCEQHIAISETTTRIETNLTNLIKTFEEIKERMVEHIHEGEKAGGVRERLTLLEVQVKELKKILWIRVFIAGVIGGLVGSKSIDVVTSLIQWIIK